MDRLKFNGDTLGHRHRNYNMLFQEITNQSNDILTDIDPSVDDVHNLFRIDVASRKKNVEYILGVLQGNDLLYVARAIKQCPWLITDDQYAHIINPKHLHSSLLPLMMAKATNKFMLSIRLNLRDEHRVESFFDYYENLNLYTALKWLPHCSVDFMEAKVKQYSDSISTALLKRLCEKNHNVLKVYINITNKYFLEREFQATMFLLNTHTSFYLDLVETRKGNDFPKFNSKSTHFMMKACPERVYQNFEKYVSKMDIPTFVKCLPPNDIADFLLKQAKKEDGKDNGWLNYRNIEYFIERMPLVQRVEFVTEVFIKKTFDQNKTDFRNQAMANLYRSVTHNGNNCKTSYYWYKFSTFDDALKEIKETTKSVNNKNEVLNCLIQIVCRDLQRIEELLQYYQDKHDGDACGEKYEFVTRLCTSTNVFKYNTNSWNILNNILGSTCLFKDECPKCFKLDEDNQICLQAVIGYKVMNNEEVPEVIMNKLNFSILYQSKINEQNSEDKSKLFDYLYNHLFQKIQKQNFADPTVFDENIDLIKLILKFLNNWNKNLADYTGVWNKCLELLKVKKDGLTWIYNMNKRWRKFMFEESIVLSPSEKTCMNALKHDASLLLRNEKEISAMRCNDTVFLRQLFRKLKTYWPQSLAFEWSQAYRERLEEPLGHKALMRGLSSLLPQCEWIKIINHYKPVDAKICWSKDDETVVSLRKHIAKNMHLARPQPDPNMILLYAKGDYLQFALGSLLAIFYNLCAVRCRTFVPGMLDAPVSLQKHGIRLAFNKMESDDLIPTLCNHWKSNKNVSIRTVMFKLTFKLLCTEKNPDKLDKIWSLLNIFIDTATFKEDKTIYELLSKVEKVPLKVRPFYLMKSYIFLKSLLSTIDIDSSRHKIKRSLNHLINNMNVLITSLEPKFIENILNDYITAVYTKEKTDVFIPYDIVPLMVLYLLYTENEETQIHRYEAVLVPILKHTFALKGKNKQDFIAMKGKLEQILRYLRDHLRQVVLKNMNVPVTIYAKIQRNLEESLSGTENYQTLRVWKLTVAFANILNESKEEVDRSKYGGEVEKKEQEFWDAVCTQAAPKFSNVCVELLKEDMEIFFPCIYDHFSKALNTVLVNAGSKRFEIEVLSHILKEDVRQTYLVTILLLPSYSDDDESLEKLYKVILSHPSLEVKMHFYHKNKNNHRFRI